MGIKKNDKMFFKQQNGMEYGYWYSTNRSTKHPYLPTITEDDYEYILNHSRAIYCFVSDAEILQKINLIKIKFLPERSILLTLLKVVKLEELLFLAKTKAIKMMLNTAKV
jgi:long-subunit acyl-CoA synthetase (AMP-forming)